MTSYQSTETFDSTAYPGVKYTLRKWSVGRRREYNKAMVKILHRNRIIQDEIFDLIQEEKQAQERADIAPCTCTHGPHEGACKAEGCTCKLGVLDREKRSRYIELVTERAMIHTEELQPTRMRWAVESVENLTVDGEPVDLERLMALGPDELTAEIDAKIESMLFPMPEETKNSPSPITSTGPGDGATTNTDAVPVAA